MPNLKFTALWDNHPYPDTPCTDDHLNQCAIRLGVALEKSGLKGIQGCVRCWGECGGRHILKAQQLADALAKLSWAVGHVEKHKSKVSWEFFAQQQGIVFIMDGWGPTDHIDLWNGSVLRGGDLGDFEKGKEVWFWKL